MTQATAGVTRADRGAQAARVVHRRPVGSRLRPGVQRGAGRRGAAGVQRRARTWTWSCPPAGGARSTPTRRPRCPARVLFLDGVRRIDARIWVHGDATRSPLPGIAASFAAGLVGLRRRGPRSPTSAVERGLFTAAAEARRRSSTRQGELPGQAGRPGPGLDQLSLALQQRLTDAEVQLALAFRAAHPAADDLLVVDGPLRGRTHLDRTVGYIKTHHASYLPAEQAAVVAALAAGPAHPGVHDGHLLAAQLLVPAAARHPRRALVRRGPPRMLGRPAARPR